VACALRAVNGEAGVLVTIPGVGTPFALVHLETRGGRVQGIRVIRDPRRLRWYTPHSS
jgi:hypothetical protein